MRRSTRVGAQSASQPDLHHTALDDSSSRVCLRGRGSQRAIDCQVTPPYSSTHEKASTILSVSRFKTLCPCTCQLDGSLTQRALPTDVEIAQPSALFLLVLSWNTSVAKTIRETASPSFTGLGCVEPEYLSTYIYLSNTRHKPFPVGACNKNKTQPVSVPVAVEHIRRTHVNTISHLRLRSILLVESDSRHCVSREYSQRRKNSTLFLLSALST